MDAPAGASADDAQDKKAEVFRAMPPADSQHYVRGQYEAYADVPGAAPGSTTETYVALRLEIDNWRWADVPVFLRAGKALPHKVTEVRLFLRRTPRLAFLSLLTRAGPNQIVLRIDPDPGLRLRLSALAEPSWRPVHLDTSFARELGEPAEPYERLLHAAIAGDHQPFAREDSVEETWRIVQPLLDHPPDVRPYLFESWGPRRRKPWSAAPALAAAVAAHGELSPTDR
jgi:glucose-6-phosphate 1-dehydrogenase